MKKITVSFLMITSILTAANAQKVYVQGGANFANISSNKNGDTEDKNTLTSFNAGVMGTFGISKIIDIETGLLFTGKGVKAESIVNDNNYVKSKFNPYYIELPVNLLVKFPISGTSHLFVNAGPYAAVGVAGKSKVETKFLGVTTNSESNIQFNNDDPTTSQQEDASYSKIKRFDYGLNFGGGVAFKSLILKANYGLGLAKINSTQTNNSDDQKNKYRTVSLSVGIPL
jgi:hypothetical protein